MFDSIPVIAITGNSNTYERKEDLCIRQRGFQECDNVSIMRPLTKYSVCINNPQEIRYELEKAFFYATNGRKGPVHIDLPMDIQRAEINPELLRGYVDTSDSFNADFDMFCEKIELLLSNAQRPCFILGNAIKTERVKNETVEMINRLGIPYVTSMISFDSLGTNQYNYGFLGAYGNRAANFIAAKSDLIISLGSRLDVRQVGAARDKFAQDAIIVRIDIDAGELTYKLHNDNLPNKFIREISNYVPARAIISTDVGQNQVWVAQSFVLKEEQITLFSGGMGAMGHALPSAIGASYNGEHRPLICICGDGGMQMNMQELQYIARERIPIKIIVINNFSLGMIRHFQEMYFGNNYYQTTESGGYSAPDFVKVANAYGIEGISISSLEEVNKVKEYLDNEEACMIEIRITENTYVVPKLEYGKPNQDQQPLIDRDLYQELMK